MRMVHVRTAYRLLIPLSFLGYSAFYLASTADAFRYSLQTWALEKTQLSDGSLTKAIDSAFANLAPHQAMAVDLAGSLRFALFGELKPGAVRGRDGYLFAETEIVFSSQVPSRVAFAATQISKVKDILRSMGIELILVPLPTKMDVERHHHDYQDAARVAEQAYADLISQAQSLGVRTVDARSVWQGAGSGGNLTHRTDQHWTVHGAAVVAQAVARVVGPQDAGLVKLTPTPETLFFQGDLARFIGSEDVSASMGYPVEVIRPLLASYAPPLAIADPDYTLVGTSESVDTRWSFAALLESNLQARVDNKAMSGLGPLYPMWQAIRQMNDSSPRTVIWEFPVGAIFKDNELYVENALP